MSIKDWFGFGDKKRDQGCRYPDGGVYDDRHYGNGYVHPTQYYRDPPPDKKSTSMPPLNVSGLVLPNCTVEKTSVDKLIDSLYPKPVDNPTVNTDNVNKEAQADTKEIGESKNANGKTDDAQKVGSKISTLESIEPKPQPVRTTLAQARELVVIFVENTPDILEQKIDVLNVLKGILDNHKNSLFLLNRLGKTNTYFGLLDYEDIISDNTLSELINAQEPSDDPKLSTGFVYVNKHINKKIWPRFDFKNIAYRISTCNIICIGNRETIDSEIAGEDISKAMLDIADRMELDVFKYLCFGKEKEVTVFSLKLPKSKSGIYIPIRPQPKDIIVFVVENTTSVLSYKNTFMAILSQIATNQKNALFLLVKVGTTSQHTELVDYDTLSKNKLLNNLFEDSSSLEETDLASAMQYVKNTLSPHITGKFAFNNRDCVTSSVSFIFIGTGSAYTDDDSKETVSTCIKAFTRWSKTKNLKYLCVSDRETIKAASLGFPDVRHIITNFYY